MPNKEEEIIKDIVSVATKNRIRNGETFGRTQYLNDTSSKFSKYELYDNGKDWTYYCSKAGFLTKSKEQKDDDYYFNKLQIALNDLKRFPKVSERKKYNLNFSKRRWATLKDFIEYAIRNGKVKPPNHFIDEFDKAESSFSVSKEITYSIVKSVSEAKRMVPPIPQYTKRDKWERTDLEGFPYAPYDESGVIALFAILCSKGILPMQITQLNSSKGIDGIYWDDNKKQEVKFELKFRLSKASWNHPFDSFDVLICWEKRWKDFPKGVIELKEVLSKMNRII